MGPKIIENHREIGVDVGRIVRRILSHLSPDILEGLHEVRLLEKHDHGFACYKREEGSIEIYVADLLGYLPGILLKLFYPFTYMFVGMAVGHELDHHVTRNHRGIDREASAEANIMRYVYPSLGIFKPVARMISLIGRPLRKLLEKKNEKIENGQPGNQGDEDYPRRLFARVVAPAPYFHRWAPRSTTRGL